jgi:hypothetical protein
LQGDDDDLSDDEAPFVIMPPGKEPSENDMV